MSDITPRQREIFDYIVWYLKENQIPPTVRDIGDNFGITSPNGVLCHLRPLALKGYIDQVPNVSRGIRVLVKNGTCPCCGQPIKANEDPADIAANLAADGA